MREANSRMARSASSLPGITKSMRSGSQSVSTMAMIGIPSLRASWTAIISFFGSTMQTASGSRSIFSIPARVFSRRRRRLSSRDQALLENRLKSALSMISRSSSSRATLFRIVAKLVSRPPSQRWFT